LLVLIDYQYLYAFNIEYRNNFMIFSKKAIYKIIISKKIMQGEREVLVM